MQQTNRVHSSMLNRLSKNGCGLNMWACTPNPISQDKNPGSQESVCDIDMKKRLALPEQAVVAMLVQPFSQSCDSLEILLWVLT